MTKQFYRITEHNRSHILQSVQDAPIGYVVEIKPETRSMRQNAKFHPICGDVAKQAEFNGRKLTPAQWKVLFISGHAIATGIGAMMAEGLEGEMVNLRESSAQMGIKRMSSLIEYVLAWCADNEIRLTADSRLYDDKAL